MESAVTTLIDAAPGLSTTTAFDVGPEALAPLIAAGARVVASDVPEAAFPVAEFPVAEFPDPEVIALAFTGARAAHDLLVGVTHDLRSPLSSILVLVEQLRRGQAGTLNATQDRLLGLVQGAAFHMAALTNDTLDYARGARSLVQDAPSPTHVQDVLGSIRALVLPIAEERRLHLRFSAPALGMRLGHAGLLHRVLANLATNALRYTESGGVSISVRETDCTILEFEVRDSGTGLPDPLATWVRDGSLVAPPHQGVGLALCRRLLESVGSRLEYAHGHPSGSQFRFQLAMPPVSTTAS
jgi:signal transduction histidine kinase